MSKAAELAALIGSQTALSHRNLIINGAMQVAQRATSKASVSAGSDYHTIDRYLLAINAMGTFTLSQAADGPSGFSTAYKLDCTTANASPAAGAYILFIQNIEAQHLQSLDFGSSGAKQITLSFYVKSNKTGTYIVELSLPDAGTNLKNQQSYTINSANTWERKTLTYVGNTTASDAINNDNGNGMGVHFWVGAGSTFGGGTLNSNVWANTASANRAAGQVNLADSTSNEWSITGVQLELGEQATPFEHRSFGDEFIRCQRYHQRFTGVSNARVGFGTKTSATNARCILPFNTPMRATPAQSVTGTPRFETGAAAQNVSSINTSGANTLCGSFDATTASGGAQNDPGVLDLGDGGYIFDAELS